MLVALTLRTSSIRRDITHILLSTRVDILLFQLLHHERPDQQSMTQLAVYMYLQVLCFFW
jgi:hypothetical protein